MQRSCIVNIDSIIIILFSLGVFFLYSRHPKTGTLITSCVLFIIGILRSTNGRIRISDNLLHIAKGKVFLIKYSNTQFEVDMILTIKYGSFYFRNSFQKGFKIGFNRQKLGCFWLDIFKWTKIRLLNYRGLNLQKSIDKFHFSL